MFVLVEERLIHADVETVYDISTDLLQYDKWNPWNISASHKAVVGEFSHITVILGKKQMTVRHKILEMITNQSFVWCDTGFFTYFAYGQRSRTFQVTENGVLYRCELKVTGILSFLAKLLYLKKIRIGMQAESDALQQTAENRIP